MMEIDLDPNNLHHAYLLIGEVGHGEAFLKHFSNVSGVALSGNPDFFTHKTELLGIDDAREITRLASQKAFGEKKIFFLSPLRVSLEAQNALLKTFEDPYPHTHFFLVMREALLEPTLLSRMMVLDLRNYGVGSNKKGVWSKEGEVGGNRDGVRSREKEVREGELMVRDFLAMSIKERLAFSKKFVDNEENLSLFLDNLLTTLRQSKSSGDALSKVYQARRVSDDRSVSARLIVEHLSLVL